MKRIFILALCFILLFPCLFSCNEISEEETTTQISEETTIKEEETTENKTLKELNTKMITISDLCYRNFLDNFWDEEKGYFVNYYKEGIRTTANDLVWQYYMVVNALETYYNATGDQTVLEIIRKEINAFYELRSEEWLLTLGSCANPAVDDAVSSISFWLLAYRLFEDEKALSYAHTLMTNILTYFGDGDASHGLKYCYFSEEEQAHAGDNEMKSIHWAGTFVLNALEYHSYTKGTEKEDATLFENAMKLYEWVEAIGRRNGQTFDGYTVPTDGLYYNSALISSITGNDIPKGYNRTEDDFVKECYSHSGLSVNMTMAVVNKRMYDEFGEQVYLDKAIQTANSLNSRFYKVNGIYLNDGDAWVNCSACGIFVKEVLPLDGIDKTLGKLFVTTTNAIMKYAYYEDGFLGADWFENSTNWADNENYGNPLWITTNANTIHMIFAARLAVKLGLVDWKSSLAIFPKEYTQNTLPKKFADMKEQYKYARYFAD